jgi:hypothetical protein
MFRKKQSQSCSRKRFGSKFVNNLGNTSGCIPAPVSFILTITSFLSLLSFFSIAVIDILPLLVNLIALLNKLLIT